MCDLVPPLLNRSLGVLHGATAPLCSRRPNSATLLRPCLPEVSALACRSLTALPSRRRQRRKPRQHLSKQSPVQMPLGQQQPVVPCVLHQPPAGLHQPMLQARQRPALDPARQPQPPPQGQSGSEPDIKPQLRRCWAFFPGVRGIAGARRRVRGLRRTPTRPAAGRPTWLGASVLCLARRVAFPERRPSASRWESRATNPDRSSLRSLAPRERQPPRGAFGAWAADVMP